MTWIIIKHRLTACMRGVLRFSANVFLSRLLLRCRHAETGITENASQGVDLMTTLDIKQEVEDVQRKLRALSHLAATVHKQSEINQKKAHLEKQFQDVSDTAAVADEITRLQRLADEIREFTKKRKFYQLNQIATVAINEVKSFHQNFSEAAPEEIFDALDMGISALKTSLDLMLQTTQQLQAIDELNENSSLKKLRNWAINLEILAEELEDNLPFLSAEAFECLTSLGETLVLKSHKRGEDAKTKRERERRRIRFAAGFILNLVEMAREEAAKEDEEVIQDIELLSRDTLNEIYREDEEEWYPTDRDLGRST
jgi:hypothetical protein